jgi:dTDP-4-amino-4,6-dideoxygalactose transaminase
VIPFVDLRPAVESIRSDIDSAIKRTVDRGIFLNGPEVEAFEEAWSRYVGVSHTIAVASGTDALSFACAGRDWLIPAHVTPFVLRGVQRARGASVVGFVDVDHRGMPVRSGDTLKGYGETTVYEESQLLPVSMYGRYPDRKQPAHAMDLCQAHGFIPDHDIVRYAAWSGYPTKNLGAFGDCGWVTCSGSRDAADLREAAATRHSRMSELDASVLRTKLKCLNDWNAERTKLAQVYFECLPDSVVPVCRPDEESNHHLFAISWPFRGYRKYLEEALSAAQIGWKVHYPNPLAQLPGAVHWCSTVLSLPMYVGLTAMQIREVCDCVRSVCGDK